MIITAVDTNEDLFHIKNCIDPTLLDNIDLKEILELDFAKENWQEQYNRRRLTENRLLLDIANSIRNNLTKLNEITKIEVTNCTTGFWLDGPGFTMARHLDNSDVFAAMQLYLTEATDIPGTKFTDNGNKIRYTFRYQKNSGYLMINNMNQYHEVDGIVPDNSYRLCSYTWFLPKL